MVHSSQIQLDFKQLFDNKNNSQLKDSVRHHPSNSNHSGQKISRQLSRADERKVEDATIKFHRDDDFDVSEILTPEEF